PYGFAKLTSHLEAIIRTPDPQAKKELLRSEASFNLWQSILRGSGAITGCRRCADVCPVGADYPEMLAAAVDDMPEDNDVKRLRLADMVRAEAEVRLPNDYLTQQRWIGGVVSSKVDGA